MTRNFLPAAFGVILVLGCLDAQAMPASDTAVMLYSGANELTHQGNYVVDFIEGKLVPSDPGHAAPKAPAAEADRAASYAALNVVMTVAFFAAIAIALMGAAVFGWFSREERPIESAGEDLWRESLIDMLEADLRNLDSMTHGFSSR